jgi:hypothetical protein
MGLEEEQVAHVYANLERKRRGTEGLRMGPIGYEGQF